MKVLWLCNSPVIEENIKTTGSWLRPMAVALSRVDDIELSVLVQSKTVKTTSIIAKNDISQYFIPQRKTYCHGQIPSKKSIEDVKNIVNQVRPDLIHIWGTEQMWAYMNTMGCFGNIPTLLEIQGLLYAYVRYYYGGLTNTEILQSVHLKELIMPWRSLYGKKYVFYKRGQIEKKSIKSFDYIGYQSDWVKYHLQYLGSHAKLYNSKIILRDSFYESSWHYHFNGRHPIVYTMCSDAISYKGIHSLLKSIALVRDKFPDVELRIAGNMFVGNRLLDGYSIFLKKLISKLSLTSNVSFLGSLEEHEIVEDLKKADVCVMPSFVETYGVALAEAMIVGLPTIVGYSSGTACLSKHNVDVLFYNPIDYHMCAAYIEAFLEDVDLAERISRQAKINRNKLNNKTDAVNNQIDIYKQIIRNNETLRSQKQ